MVKESNKKNKKKDFTGTEMDMQKHYTYELLEDLSFGKERGFLVQHHTISTATSTAACGVDLEKGKTYLLGGSLDTTTHQPSLVSCSAYSHEWDSTCAQSMQ